MKEGDIVRGESGERYQLGELMAVQGKADCVNPCCAHRYVDGRMLPGCLSYHCPRCGESTSMLGHECGVPEQESAA